MTEEQLRLREVELEEGEQKVTTQIAELRERMSALETRREYIRLERASARVEYMKANQIPSRTKAHRSGQVKGGGGAVSPPPVALFSLPALRRRTTSAPPASRYP
jgi:hypothetical protein